MLESSLFDVKSALLDQWDNMKTKSLSLLVYSVYVYDGDTVYVVRTVGGDRMSLVGVRLDGVDAPELSNTRQRTAANAVRNAAADWVWRNYSTLKVREYKLDKYAGRIVGDLISDEGSLASYLLLNGLVKPYSGRKKSEWTDEELDHVYFKACDLDTGAEPPTLEWAQLAAFEWLGRYGKN